MKKLVSFILCACLLFIAGCSKTTTVNSTSTKTNSKTTQLTTTKTSNTTSNVREELFKEPIFPDFITNYETFEIKLEEIDDTKYISKNGNPYKTEDYAVDAYFTSPSGEVYYRPAFWMQDYKIQLSPIGSTPTYYDGELVGTDLATAIGDPGFKIRFKPVEEGEWQYVIYTSQGGIVTQTITGKFNAQESSKEYDGVLKVDKTNNRYFVFSESGKTYVPVGQNVSWYTTSRKSYDYDVWFGKMAENNANFARIWMASWSFALHIGAGAKIDNFDKRQNAAARLDRVLNVAVEDDIYVLLCLNNHGQFTASVNPEWSENPYNVKNGGILTSPGQFFSSPEAKKIYKDELRYIVARYATYESIMAWELFNEVDWTDNFNAINVSSWHDEMATYLKEIDCYDHMTTTSYKYTSGLAYKKEVIDFVNPHSYDFNNKVTNLELPKQLNSVFTNYQKPVLFQEIGVDWESGGNTAKKDPNGIFFYQALWSAVMGGGAGTGMVWWWDSYTHPCNAYRHYKGIGAYTKEMNLTGSDLEYIKESSSSVTLNAKTNLKFYGIKFSNRVYGYLYDVNYVQGSLEKQTFTDVRISLPLTNGEYTLRIFDTITGEIIKNEIIIVSGNIATINFESFSNDVAFIID